MACNLPDKDLMRCGYPYHIPNATATGTTLADKLPQHRLIRRLNAALSRIKRDWYKIEDRGGDPTARYVRVCQRYLVRRRRRGWSTWTLTHEVTQ